MRSVLLLSLLVVLVATAQGADDAPSASPTTEDQTAYVGPGFMKCIATDDRCDFENCDIEDKRTLDRLSDFGTLGPIEFQVTNTCTMFCTDKCTFTPDEEEKEGDSGSTFITVAFTGIFASLLAVLPFVC